MITKEDEKQVKELQQYLNKIELRGNLNGSSNSETLSFTFDKIDLLDKMIENLKKAPESYRYCSDEDKKRGFYTAKCNKCGWFGNSKLLNGGGQIADTGDYDDSYCPVCGNSEFDEMEELDIKKYMKHLSTCGMMQNWLPATQAMLDIPDGEEKIAALERLCYNINTCTCGLEEILKQMLWNQTKMH